MALKQNHDYKQIYDETYAFMSKAIGDGALNGGKDGLVRALSNLEIDGKKININDKNIQAAIEKHFQNAFKNIKIKDFKIAKIDFSDLFNLDKKALQNEVNKVLKDLEVNQSSKEANRRLYALGTVANAKGYDVIGAGGGKIDKEYLKDLQHYAGITDTHVEMINKRIGEIGKNIDLSGLIKELIDMTNQMDKAAEKAAKDAEKMQKAQKKAEDAAKKSAAKTKAEKAKTTTDKKQETPSPPAPTVDTTKTTKDIDKMDQVVRDTEEDVHKLQMALKDALGFGYAIDDKSNPLQSLITNVQDGVATLEETMEKVKKVGKFNELINTSDVATQATSGEGLEKFNSSLVEIADNSLTAEDAFNKFRNEVKGGSNFIGNEGQTTAKRKDDIADLSNELKRLQDVLAQVADSENDFEQKIAQDAKKSIETIEDYIQKKSMVFDAHAQKWVPVKPKEEKIQEEVSKKKLNFDNPEMQNVLAAMFGKATETKQEVEKVAESFDEVAQSGTSAGEKIAKGMAEVRQEAKKTKETIKEVKQATDEETKPVESSDFQKARINQQLEALRKIRNQKEADYKTEKRHLDDLQALSNAYYQRMQNTVGVDNYKEAYQNARRENFDLIDNKPVSHTDALFHQAQVHAKRFARTGDDQSLGKAAGYYQQYVNAMKEANQEAEKLKIGKKDLSDKLLKDAEAFQKFGATDINMDEWNKVNKEIVDLTGSVEKLEAEYNNARDSFDHFKQSMQEVNQKGTTDTVAEIEAESAAEEKLAEKKKETADAAKAKADTEKESESVSDNSDAIAQEEKEKEAIDETKESLDKKTAARKEEQSVGANGEAAEQNRKEAEEAKAAADAYEKKEEAKRAEAAVQPEVPATSRVAEDLTPLETQLDHINQLISRKNELFGQEESIVKGVAQSEADALKEVASQVENISNTSTSSNSAKREDLSPLKKQLIEINQLIDEKTDKFRTEEEVVASAAKSEASSLDGVSNSLSNISSAKDGQGNQEDLSPLIQQLNRVLDLVARKNQAFYNEKRIVQDAAIAEVSALKEVAETIEHIVKLLDSISRRKISINFQNLDQLTQDGLATKLASINAAIKNLTDKEVSFNIKGIKSIENLARIDVDRLDTRLTEAFMHIDDFANAVKSIKIDDDSFLTAINSLMKDGEKLRSLATIIKASKTQIDKATAATKPKQEKIDVSAYEKALKTQNEMYKLQSRENLLTSQEKQRLDELRSTWQQIGSEIDKVTAKLKAQGQATTVVDQFAKAYRDNAGYEAYLANAANDERQKQRLGLEGRVKGFETKLDNYPTKYTDELSQEVQKLRVIINKINSHPIDKVSDDDISEVQKLATTIQSMFNSAEFKEANALKISQLKDEINAYLNQYTALSNDAKQSLRGLIDTLDDVGSAEGLNQVRIRFNEIKMEARDAGQETKTFWSKVSEQINHTNEKMLGMYLSWQDMIRYIRQASQAVIELDSALTELRKVSDASTDRLAQSFEKSADTAKELGNTVSSVINQTADFARLGFDISQAEELARVSTMFQTVGDNMTTDTASQYLVSTLQGFQLSADQAMSTIDKYNEVANHFAIDTAGIGESLKRSAASFNAAHTDLSKSIALITATNEVIQNPESVGTLWKTLGARIRGAKTELQELGEEEDEFTKSTSNLRNLVKSLTGFDIMEDEDTYKDLYEIIMGIGEAWENLTDIEQASLGEALSGKRNANAFYAVMGNLDTLKEAYETAERSAGSAEREQENYAKSVQYSVDRVKASLQELAYDFIDSGALKTAIEVFQRIIEGLDNITKATDGAVTVLGGLALAFYGVASVTGAFEKVGKALSVLQGLFTSLTVAKTADTVATKANTKATKENTGAAIENGVTHGKVGATLTTEAAADTVGAISSTGKVAGKASQELTETGFAATGLGKALSFIVSPAGLVVTALAAVAGTAFLVHQRNQELLESAYKLGNEYKESKEDIESYKGEIESLNKILNSSNTSYEDAKTARENLLSIQDALIEKYGTEAGSIQLITDAVNGQVDALEKLEKKQWEATKREYNKTKGTGFIDTLNIGWHNLINGDKPDVKNNMDIMEQDMFNVKRTIVVQGEEDVEALQKLAELVDGELRINLDEAIPSAWLDLSGDLDEIQKQMTTIYDASEAMGLSLESQQGISKQIADADKLLEKNKEIAQGYLTNEVILPNYSEQYAQMNAAYELYRKSLVEADEDAAKQLAEDAKSDIMGIMSGLEGADDTVVNYFRNMYPEIAAEINSWEFEIELKTKTISKSGVNEAIQTANKYSSLQAIKNAEYATDKETKEDYARIKAGANAYGLTPEEFVTQLKKENMLSVNFVINESSVDSFKKAAEKAKVKVSQEALTNLDEIISESDSSDVINTFTSTQWDNVIASYQRIMEASHGTKDASVALKEALEQEAEAWQKETEAKEQSAPIEFSLEGFTEASKGLKEIQSLYEKFVKQKEEGKKNPIFDASELSGMNEAIKGLEGFTEFYKTLTSGTADTNQIQTAFNNLATEYIYTTDCLKGLDETNRDFYVHQLELQGITNASEIVTQGLAEAYGVAAKQGIDLSNATDADVIALSKEANMSDSARIALQELAGAKLAAALQTIDESTNVEQLLNLAQAAGIARSELSALSGLSGLQTKIASAIKGGASGTAINEMQKAYAKQTQKAVDEATAAWEKKRAELTAAKVGSPPGGGSGKGGGGGSKDTEKEVDVLAELSKQLDEIQAAYSSLSEIVKSYNENGKLTIDQAQQLINTDFRYLAMLTDENGQLKLNEQGFQDLARAKLQEMQIQLAKNAIDTVNGLQSEADAVNFLTYAYEGLKGAALGATEAMLASAVAAAKMRGEQQGIAAEKIQAGYYATKQAIGNIDFGSDSLAGKKDSDKDKSDKDNKDKDKEEKDTKTKFNWLDRLVNKIQREIDKLSKRAEKYFNWAEKNALVDKQLAANKRMITTQQFAVDFYRNKTNKALKKVPKKYRNLVSGDFDPTTVKKIIAEVGSGKTKKLEEYLDWQELLEGAEDALAEAYEQERELINSKLENIMNYFDDLLDYQQSIIDNLDATNELLSAQGKFQSIDTFLKSLGGQRDKYATVGERNAEYDKAANEAKKELADSYENQVEDVKKSYESSSAYNKLAKKKNLGGWQAEALQFIRDNNIQAEDVEDVLKQYKIYYKNRNKTGKQKNKADDAYKKLQEAADRAADSLGDLTKEQDEQQKLIERNAEKQKQQNEADAKQTEIDYWNNLRNLFDLMTQELDAQIRMLNTITEKYTTIYDLLDSVELADLKKYNVDDVFGIDVYGEQSKAVALRNAIESLKDSIDVYHEKFNFYGELIEVLTGTPEQVEAGIKRMLSSYDLSEEAQKYLDQIAKDLAENGFDNLNSIVQDVNENYEATRKQIADSITSSENMSKKLLDAITDQTDKLIEALTSAQQAYASRSALINDEWTVDKNGITEYGYAKIGNLNKEADIARQTALYYNKQIADLEADTTVDKESTEYKVKLNDYIKKYYDAVKSVHSINDEIYNIAQKAMQNEVDNISKLVDNYKKALNAKKAYYDYDKQIKEKNKNIQSLKAEAAALENVADQASKARLKQIQAELEEAQEDLDDTVFNHQVQVETDALDKLITDMTEALNDVGETIEETFEKWSQTVKDVVGVALGYNIDDIFNKIIDFDMNGAIDEETLAKEIAAAEAEKQKKVNEQNKKKGNAEAQIKTLKGEISSINSKYNTKLSHSGETVRNALTQVMNSDKLATQYADKIIAERKAEQEKLKAEGKGVTTIGMVGAGTSKYDWQQLYNDRKKALENAYNTAKKNYDNLVAQRDAEIAKVQEKIKTYEEAVTAAEAEIKKLQNATVVSTQTPTATAPATTGTSTVPSSVATDAQQGKYMSIQTIGEDTSAINTSLSGISENVIKLLSKSTNLYKFATDTQKPYMTTIQKQISSLTTNVSTIATNTTNISTQLTNINSSVKTVADNVKSNSNYGTYNIWNDGTYWYEGMKRMGKMVTYH